MGAIVAALDKKGEDAHSTSLTMLEELRHRGTKNPIVVEQPLTFVSQFLNESERRKIHSKVAIGSNSSDPIIGENYVLILDGRFFPPVASRIHQVMHEMARQPLKKARLILERLNGSYVFALGFSDQIIVGRDTMGTKPLYYGENEYVCAVASERKALWKIGIVNARSFPPGNLATMNQTGFGFEPISTLAPVAKRKIGIAEAANRLRKLLEKSTRNRVSDVKNVGVAFSGGLDSAVISSLAKLAGANVRPICVGLEGESETNHAIEAAERLGLQLSVQEYSVADVENSLPKVLWLIEEPNTMKAGVAVPFFWTAKVASKLGLTTLLAGQGADEIFGGYSKYLVEYTRGGAESAEEAMFRDTTMSYDTNFQRDDAVCAYHKVELRLPFADIEVARFGLSLPIDLKIKSPEDSLRKRVLRLTARKIGIPAFIANRPKRAIQFASGVDGAIEELAKVRGLTKRSYINEVFRKVYPDLGVKNG
jgi:asparagine synthase (glutamine-hydrolysing)